MQVAGYTYNLLTLVLLYLFSFLEGRREFYSHYCQI